MRRGLSRVTSSYAKGGHGQHRPDQEFTNRTRSHDILPEVAWIRATTSTSPHSAGELGAYGNAGSAVPHPRLRVGDGLRVDGVGIGAHTDIVLGKWGRSRMAGRPEGMGKWRAFPNSGARSMSL